MFIWVPAWKSIQVSVVCNVLPMAHCVLSTQSDGLELVMLMCVYVHVCVCAVDKLCLL